jgi:hypothetical protein
VEEASYHREQAITARRLSAEATWPDIREKLARLAQHYAEVAEDLELGVPVRHPELLRPRD